MALLFSALAAPSVGLMVALAWPGPPPVQPPDFCGRDAHEPNDARPYAHRLVGVVADGHLCPDDVDWFAVHLERGAHVAIAVLFDRGPKATPPAVFAPGARRPMGTPYTSEGEVGARLTAPKSGWYRVRLDGPRTDELPYVLLVWPLAGADR